MCGVSRWGIGDHLVFPNTYFPGGGLTVGGVTYPQAMLICGNCAFTAYFNAVVIGLIQGDKQQEQGSNLKPAAGGSGAG